jgi:hypothetical protein
MTEITKQSLCNALEFGKSLAKKKHQNFDELLEFLKKFKSIYDREMLKLPYHINLIDELHAKENAHSRILEKLLKQKTHDGKFEILEGFIEYLKTKGGDSFNKICVENPQITQEIERIDLWIRDKSYAIIIENKVHRAGDQSEQLARYIEKTKETGYKEEQMYVIYLPPTHDKDPDEQTWGEYKKKFEDRYLKISFKDDILPWLKDLVLPNTKIKDNYLSSALEQYIDHLEGIFSLRTINNQMNMELQEFIKQELGLQENNLEEAIATLSEKETELNNAINQIQQLKETFQRKKVILYFEQIKESLKNDFPTMEIVGDKFERNKDVINVGVKCSLKNQKFSALIEYNDYKKPNIYYGLGRAYASETKLDELIINLGVLDIPDGDKNSWWYSRKDTSFKNGYTRLKSLIEKVDAMKENQC